MATPLKALGIIRTKMSHVRLPFGTPSPALPSLINLKDPSTLSRTKRSC
jgi:hypothetical protein